MDIDSTKLTVFFEAPFWIGVFERIERRKLSVCKVVFILRSLGVSAQEL